MYFKYYNYCDGVDNDMITSFNSGILRKKYKIIIIMLEEIKAKVMSRIEQLKEFSNTWITDNFSTIQKIMQDNITISMKCSLEWNDEFNFKVKDRWDKYFYSEFER